MQVALLMLLACSLAACAAAEPEAGRVWDVRTDLVPKRREPIHIASDSRTGNLALQAGDKLELRSSEGEALWSVDGNGSVWFDSEGALNTLNRKLGERGDVLRNYSLPISHEIAIDSQGNILVLGDALQKLDSDRSLIWEGDNLLFGLGTPHARAVNVDSRDRIIVAWAGMGGECVSRFQLLKYDPEGELMWSRCIDLEQSPGDLPIAIDQSDEILVAGRAFPSKVPDGSPTAWQLARFSPEGEVRWIRELATLITSRDGILDVNENALSALAVDFDNHVIAVGRTLSRVPSVSVDIWVQASDGEASVKWTKEIATNPGTDDVGAGVALDDEGNILVLGKVDYPEVDTTKASPRVWVSKLRP